MSSASKMLPLRSSKELLDRLLCLWAVTGTAYYPDNTFFGDYLRKMGIEPSLSKREHSFLYSRPYSERDIRQFTWMHECLYVLAWCGSLVPTIHLPKGQAQLGETVMNLFPDAFESPIALQNALRLRSSAEIHGFTEQIYQAHWRVRDAKRRESPVTDGLDGEVIQEWHLALNWITKYEDEDDWDAITTDT
jgi:Domain of unknown function (DUF4272)